MKLAYSWIKNLADHLPNEFQSSEDLSLSDALDLQVECMPGAISLLKHFSRLVPEGLACIICDSQAHLIREDGSTLRNLFGELIDAFYLKPLGDDGLHPTRWIFFLESKYSPDVISRQQTDEEGFVWYDYHDSSRRPLRTLRLLENLF